MASPQPAVLDVTNDPNDNKTIIRLMCSVDAEVEIFREDGTKLMVVLRAGVAIEKRFDRVFHVQLRTFGPGKSAPTN